MTERAASDIHVHMCIRDSSLLPDTSQPRRWPSRSVHTASRQWPDPTGGHRNGIRSHGSWARRAVLQELWGITEKTQSKQTLTAQISLGIFPFCRNTGGNLVHSWIPTMPLCSNNVPLRVQNTHNALMFLGIRSISDPGTDLEWKQACGPFLTLVTLSDVSQIWPWPLLLKPLNLTWRSAVFPQPMSKWIKKHFTLNTYRKLPFTAYYFSIIVVYGLRKYPVIHYIRTYSERTLTWCVKYLKKTPVRQIPLRQTAR